MFKLFPLQVILESILELTHFTFDSGNLKLVSLNLFHYLILLLESNLGLIGLDKKLFLQVLNGHFLVKLESFSHDLRESLISKAHCLFVAKHRLDDFIIIRLVFNLVYCQGKFQYSFSIEKIQARQKPFPIKFEFTCKVTRVSKGNIVGSLHWRSCLCLQEVV